MWSVSVKKNSGISKNGFPTVFANRNLARVGSFFGQKNFSLAKLPAICLCFGGVMPEDQIKQCQIPPPTPLIKELFLKIQFSSKVVTNELLYALMPAR